MDSEKPTAVKRRAGKAKKKQEKVKAKLWTFPKNTLEQAVRVAQAIEEKNAGNPMHAADLAKAVGYRQPNDWRFLDLLRSANQYGLLKGSGPKATITLEKLGQDIVAPSTPLERQRALREAFLNVAEFKNVEEFYKGKRIPEDEFFLNTLTRQFLIPRERVQKFAEVFLANRTFLQAFAPQPSSEMIQRGVDATVGAEVAKPADVSGVVSGIVYRVSDAPREFLDTCL